MKSKRNYIKGRANSKITRLNLTVKVLIIIMSLIVLYDSVIHNTPLYYIVFFFLGRIVGQVFSVTQKVEGRNDSGEISLTSGRWNILLMLVLILLRLAAGRWILEEMHVVWPTDALYLFFIGIYQSKWKSIVDQIDERVYQFLINYRS